MKSNINSEVKMKSNINSDGVKKLISEAVEKAIQECAKQHQYNVDAHPYNSQPNQLKLTFSFKFDGSGEIQCQPVIDLSNT